MTTTLCRQVLVLNKSWIPVHITTVKRAICMVYADLARVVDVSTYQTYGFKRWCSDAITDRFIKTSSRKIPVPEIIVLTAYNGLRTKAKMPFSRIGLFRRDKNTCQYCGRESLRKNLTIDHVLPKSRGGKTSWTNCVVACLECNSRKDSKTPKEAKMTLLHDPVMPSWSVRLFDKQVISKNSWGAFFGDKYD